MALKTLDTAAKAEFSKASITLTPALEHHAKCYEEKVLLPAGLTWAQIIAAVGKLITILLAAFGGTTPPAPTQAKQGVTCPCDHHDSCKKTFDAAIHTAKLAGDHLAACCCENC